ncbi:MAG: class II fructose-bisphosphate aldolase [Thermodesulfobacteriota bacterium]
MQTIQGVSAGDLNRALEIGRPPNVAKLFPHSKALLVSGKVIDRALIAKGKAVAIAASVRNSFVARGALKAAARANAAILIEIAKSEGGADAYCAVNLWNMARLVDSICNELGISVPVAIHADHYGIKGPKDVDAAKTEIPSLFDAGITSIAIDASHLPDAENLLASLELCPLVPSWSGFETEVGEIKGKEGLSTVPEALFLVQGLNAHGFSPEWIALNNGTTHGIEATGGGIQIELTAAIHKAIEPYGVSGAQHGTSGNSYDKLRAIVSQTRTTKANVATALQMVSWGVEVNEFGNARLDADKNFIKIPNAGIPEYMWEKMVAFAKEKGWKGGDYKKLNRPFENKLLGLPREVREEMAGRVEDFVYDMIVNVFNGHDTAPLAIEAILKAGSYDLGPKVGRIADPAEWTTDKIKARAATLGSDKGPEGDFED